jgi:predicted O-methyltransferase YrrM
MPANRINPNAKHPERYTVSERFETESQVIQLIAAYVHALQPDFVLETGTAEGEASVRIAQVLHEDGNGGHLYTVELSEPRARVAIERLKELPATVIIGDAFSWIPPSDVRFDFAYFDGGRHRHLEFRHYKPWLTNQTIVAFHDTANGHPCIRGINELVRNGEITPPIFLPTPRGIAFAVARVP